MFLLGGQSLPNVAATLHFSRNAAHTQLASIFRRTDTSSQVELIRELLCGPGAVRMPGDSSESSLPMEGGP